MLEQRDRSSQARCHNQAHSLVLRDTAGLPRRIPIGVAAVITRFGGAWLDDFDSSPARLWDAVSAGYQVSHCWKQCSL
jgi:hypothetical protein